MSDINKLTDDQQASLYVALLAHLRGSVESLTILNEHAKHLECGCRAVPIPEEDWEALEELLNDIRGCLKYGAVPLHRLRDYGLDDVLSLLLNKQKEEINADTDSNQS